MSFQSFAKSQHHSWSSEKHHLVFFNIRIFSPIIWQLFVYFLCLCFFVLYSPDYDSISLWGTFNFNYLFVRGTVICVLYECYVPQKYYTESLSLKELDAFLQPSSCVRSLLPPYDLNRVPPLTKLLLWPARICCQAIPNYINDRLLPEECSCHPLSPSIMALLHYIFCFCR